MVHRSTCCQAFLAALVLLCAVPAGAEDWRQFKYDSRHSGNAPDRRVAAPLGLVGAVALTDAICTSPVVAKGRVYVVDASGVAHCLDAQSLRVLWRVATPGGPVNVGNVSSPAVADGCLHFGTTSGVYYVLDARDGTVVRRIACGEPILAATTVISPTPTRTTSNCGRRSS